MALETSRRTFAVLLALAQLLLGCPRSNPPLAPSSGFVERRELNLVAVPGGFVDLAGGNLLIRRTDLELDTRLGRESLGAVYDAASGRWRWSFESHYDGAIFVDESGASFAVAGLAAGAAVPGTQWVKLDATRMKTKGGLVHEYGAGGLLAARYWSSDPHPRIRHASAVVAGTLRPTALEQCTSASACTPLFAFSYDAAGQLVSVVDRAGRRAEFGWDAAGRLASARDALDVAQGWPGFRYTYQGTLLRSQTNSEGEQTSYAYSGRALTSATQEGPGLPVHRFHYEGKDGAGLHHTRFWNPLGEERRFAYDAQGRLLEQLEVTTGELTRFAWSGERRIAETLPSGATTLWSWSGDDVHTRTDPSGNVVSFTYPPAGVNREDPRVRPVLSVHDSLGAVETRSYDASGRLLEVRNGAGDATRYTWSGGALASETRAGITRSFSHVGDHGHATRVTALGATEVRSFDAVGNLIRGSDGRTPVAGGIGLRSFDEDRNLVALELHPQSDALPPETLTLAYRSDGQRLRVLRGGDDHELVYDAFGRRVEQRERADGVWRVTRFGHDAAGRLSFVERPNGMREELDWGPGGRPAAVRRFQGSALESALAFVYAEGELVRVDDSTSGSEHYVYDAAGRLVATRFAGGEQLVVQRDLRSRVSSESFVAAGGALLATLLHEHDLADRRVRSADLSGLLLETTWADGRVTGRRHGNGLVRSYAYRSDGLLAGTTTHNAAGEEVEATTLESEVALDAEGTSFLRQRATTATWGGVDVLTVEEYALSPVLDGGPGGARVARWNDGLGADEVYAFDARSNLRAQGDTSFVYNAEGNRLLSLVRGGETVGSYAYDAAGFASARNGVPLAWNAAGRLVAHGADTLVWDGMGRLREAEVGGVQARFAFGGRVQADAQGTPLAIDLGEVLVGLAGVHRYRHLDFRGNVKFVSDDAGQVVAHYRYAPFGLDAVFGADDDPVRFAARPELGELMLLGERVYDPAVGRFLSPDPVFQLVNQFAYTLGNPVWFSDPDGRSSEANDSAAGFDRLIGTLSVIASVLGLLSVLLRFGPLPHFHALSSLLSLVAALIALMVALAMLFGRPQGECGCIQIPDPALGGDSGGSGGSGGGGGGSGGGGGGGGGGVGAGCSPAALTALPEARGWLRFLIPLQLVLGFLVVRKRRAERRT
jgi:RHS repeat-associated protein